MKKVLLIYLVLIAAIAAWWLIAENEGSGTGDKPPKDKAITVSKHSDGFNESVEKMLADYHKITNNFVNADIISANENANRLKMSLDDLKLDELKKDSAGIYETSGMLLDNTKGSVQQMIDESTLDAKRKAFKDLSDNLYTFINSIHYDAGKLYWTECPGAFGEGSPGFWLSDKERSENPYGQKDCGRVRKTINVPK